MSGSEKTPENYLLFPILLLAIAFFTFRLSPALAATLMIIAGGGMIYLAYQLVNRQRNQADNSKGDAFGSRIQQRYQSCLTREEKFRTEAEKIRLRIAQLREDLARSANAEAQEIARAQQLITEFEAEFKLRHAKAAFFADCAAKLNSLQDRYQLQRSITEGKRELDALRAANFDDEASLEETRYHLERDTIELDTIAELSKEAFVSFKAEQAEELRLRLEKLREEL